MYVCKLHFRHTENLKCAEKELSIDGDAFLLNDVSEYVVY